jgi:pyruvate dehydrogenase E2 component (dihydrolipoamide acetyltransferase)
MARWDFKLPDIGEGVTEGEIVNWLVKAGELVKENQPMVEVMTDKATVTITAPKTGKIAELRGKVGEVIAVHAVLVVFELGADTGASPPQTAPVHANGNGHTNGTANGAAKKDEGPAATAVGDIREDLPGMGSPSSRAARSSSGGNGTAQVGYFNAKPLATPATRKVARDMGVDLKTVPPSGPLGRVTKQDVLAFVTRDATPKAETRSANAPSVTREAVRIAPPVGGASSIEERVPFAGMRRKIAAKMAQSTQTAAHFTFVEECDATALRALRDRLRAAADGQGVRLTYLPFIVKAVVAALKKHPILNSALDETTNELVYRRYYNIGIAASTDAGLMVPVVKDADRRSILDIAKEIERLGTDAKAGRSKMDDLSGSTFTITSLGAQGGLFATPIINFPEVGILGVHRIKERPVVKDGQIVIGEVMLLSLSFDHRIVDGHVGAAFAYDIIGYLENPDRLFLEMI